MKLFFIVTGIYFVSSSSALGSVASVEYSTTTQFPYKSRTHGYMVFDMRGELVVPPEGNYEQLYYLADRWFASSMNTLTIYDERGKRLSRIVGEKPVYLGEGRLTVQNENGRVLIDNNGRMISSQTFEDIQPFEKGLALAKIKNSDVKKRVYYRYGYINDKGEWIIPAQYDFASDFNGNQAAVTSHKKTVLISRSGDIVRELSASLTLVPLDNEYWLETVLTPGNKKLIARENKIINSTGEVIVKNVTPVLIANNLYFLSEIFSKNFVGLLNTSAGAIKSHLTNSSGEMNDDIMDYVPDISRSEFFWLKGQYYFRMYNIRGELYLEKLYENVQPFYGDYAWVVPPDKKEWVLIDYFGNEVSEYWKDIETIAYGNNIVTYAYKNDDPELHIMDNKGFINYVEKNHQEWQGQKCNNTISVLYNRKNLIVWPKKPLIHCLASGNAQGNQAQG